MLAGNRPEKDAICKINKDELLRVRVHIIRYIIEYLGNNKLYNVTKYILLSSKVIFYDYRVTAQKKMILVSALAAPVS